MGVNFTFLKTRLCTSLIVSILLFISQNLYSQIHQEWAQRFNGQNNSDDRFSNLIVDKTNVYVTGFTTGSPPASGITTLKYNQNGDLLWVRYCSQYHYPNSICIDSNHNIYITGNTDMVTLKYDSLGNQVWLRTFLSSNDRGLRVATSRDYIYVAGSHANAPNGSNYILLKYSLNGILQWFSIDSVDNALLYDMKIDTKTNIIFLTGYTYVNYESKILTIKINDQGRILWRNYFDTLGYSSEGYALDIDSMDSIFVTGQSYKSNYEYDYHLSVIKLDSSGIVKWFKYSNGPFNFGERGYAIKIDKFQNVICTGFGETNENMEAYLTLKLNNSGDSLFENRYIGNGGFVNIANDLDIDSNGNIYITGQSTGVPPTGNNDIATIKYSPTGKLMWTVWYNSPWSGCDYGDKIKMGNDGNFYVGGISDQTQFNFIFDIITIKYSQTTGLIKISNNISNFSLSQNYPNPFNPTTKIKFDVPEVRNQKSEVRLVIYDILGHEIATLVNEELKPGSYEYEWDGSNFASGVYLYKLTTKEFSQTRKMVLMK